MRPLVLVLLPLCALAQERSTATRTYDVNGRAVEWSQARSGDGNSSETIQTINGRRAPAEQVTERVIKNEGGVVVVERLTKRFDTNGNALPPEKSVIETTKRPDGVVTQQTSVYRGDFNGRLALSERVSAEIRQSGGEKATETRVERTTLNGGLEVVERRNARETGSKEDSAREETVERKDANGRFAPQARQVVRTKVEGGVTKEQVDDYETATTGQMRLSRQTMGRSYTAADGSERREVDVFGPAALGRPTDGSMQLRERQVFTARQSADGSVVQVFAIQRPAVGEAKLGPPVKVSETVCTGKCK